MTKWRKYIHNILQKRCASEVLHVKIVIKEAKKSGKIIVLVKCLKVPKKKKKENQRQLEIELEYHA